MSGAGGRISAVLQLSARYGKQVAVVLAVVLLAAVTGVGVGLGVTAVSSRVAAARALAAIVPPPAPVVPRPALRPAALDGPAPTPTGVAAVLDPLVAAGGFGSLSGQVLDPATGTVLWQRNPNSALVPGSTVKLLTASAALLALDHQARLRTTVLAGTEPGTVVLRGGGDPTLSAAGYPAATGYPAAARLDDLVGQVRAAARGPISRVLIDVSRYAGDALAPGWVAADVAGGYIAPIEPVMLDGGRADPTQENSPRAAKPATAAAAELARRLGADPDTVAPGAAPPGAAVLGEVSSPAVQDLVAITLRRSDNVLAEALAREVARKIGAQPSFSGASQAVLTVLRRHGFDISGVTLVDGSGLSTGDAVPAALLTALLSAASGPDRPTATKSAATSSEAAPLDAASLDDDGFHQSRTAALRSLLVGLPVAGGSGTLSERYHGPTFGGRGWVRAKTGTLTGVNSLAGTVLDAEGRVLVFALVSNGPNPVVVRPRLDALAVGLRSCGCH
ncbi:MAG: D-alanyl-D-alanine carboxypeptidase/D-alanyl-D-alanine-endopeptidase [Pseudonocardiaceae bacterium]